MSSTTRRDRGWWAEWLTHHEVHVWVVVVTGLVTAQVAGTPTWVVFASLAGTALSSTALSWRHGRSVCSRCLTTPLDPQEAVRRHRVALFCHHHDGWLLLGLVVLMVTQLPVLGSRGLVAGMLLGLLGLAQFMVVMVVIHSSVTHRRLFWWCPRCQGGGGGTTVEPVPPLAPTGVRTR